MCLENVCRLLFFHIYKYRVGKMSVLKLNNFLFYYFYHIFFTAVKVAVKVTQSIIVTQLA